MKIKILFIISLIFDFFLNLQISNATTIGVFAYIANSDVDIVTVIDVNLPLNNAYIGQIKVGRYPHGVGIVPDGRKVYVGSVYSNNVSVIDTTLPPDNNAVIGTIKVGTNPRGVAVAPDGKKVYVANWNSSNISVIDANLPPNDNAVIGTIKVGESPSGIAVTPDGKGIYIASAGPNTISVIDATLPLNDNAVIGTIKVGEHPSSVTITPDGKKLYVANYVSNTISVIDTTLPPNNNAVIGTIKVEESPSGISITPDGKKLYVTNFRSDTVSVIDTRLPPDNNAIIGTIKVGKNPNGSSVTPDGKKVYVVNTTSNSISIIDTSLPPDNNAVIGIIEKISLFSPYSFGNFITNILSFLQFVNLQHVGKIGKPIQPYKIEATGSNPPFTYQVLSELPDGLVFKGDTITGTPKESKIFNILLEVTDNTMRTVRDTLILHIAKYDPPLINNSLLEASGKVGVPFEYKILGKGDPDYPDQPLAYSASNLPFGLKVDAKTGMISGTPETAGNFNVTLMVSNGETRTHKKLALSIAPSERGGCALVDSNSSTFQGSSLLFFAALVVPAVARVMGKVRKRDCVKQAI